MQTKLIIRHLEGSKKGEQETFSLDAQKEIRIGRGLNNDVGFDPVKEDTISREHCRILQDDTKPDMFTLIDSQSKNGTFVNGTQVKEKTELFAGDIIKLGKDGPTIEFDLDPRPATHIKKTRVLESNIAATKLHGLPAEEAKGTSEQETPKKEGIGKNTMQHMISQSEKKNRSGLLVSILAIALLAAAGGYFIWKKADHPTTITVKEKKETLTPTEIVTSNNEKVVYVEMAWKLTNTTSGDEMYMVYFPDGQSYKAAYIRDAQGKVVPYLTSKSDAPQGALLDPIASGGSGSGFVVDEDGYIVTNRHVATNWLTTYHFQNYAFPGVLLERNAQGQLKINKEAAVSAEDVGAWVPGNDKQYTGVNTYLDVTFANNSQRTPAQIVRVSSTHDVALIKINLPEKLPKVTMLDNYEQINPGDAAVVMGYPGIAPAQLVLKRSQDVFNTNPNITSVPVPTVSTGNVGRLVKGSEKNNKIDDYMSTYGDYYQLTINSTGGGNSGGPMFDDKGRVIGIFSAGKWEPGTSISFAVPIKYAMELMGRQQVIH